MALLPRTFVELVEFARTTGRDQEVGAFEHSACLRFARVMRRTG